MTFRQLKSYTTKNILSTLLKCTRKNENFVLNIGVLMRLIFASQTKYYIKMEQI